MSDRIPLCDLKAIRHNLKLGRPVYFHHHYWTGKPIRIEKVRMHYGRTEFRIEAGWVPKVPDVQVFILRADFETIPG